MKKHLPYLIAFLLLASSVHAAETLHSHFMRTLGFYPPISERRDVYQKLYPGEHYQGSAAQNIKFLDYLQTHQAELEGSETLGSTFQVPTTPAFYEDSLATPISSTATSFTLVRGTDKHGTALASSTYGMVIDEGNSSSEEIVLADCTSTACTNVTRGISVLTGTSTVAGAAKSHRRGASVKITTAPSVPYLTNIFRGRQNIENLLHYTTNIGCSGSDSNNTICDKGYFDSVISSGVSDANETTAGKVELSTGSEAAASTLFGSTGSRLAIPTLITTSTPFTTGNVIPVTLSNGLLSPAFMPTSSPFLFTSATNTFTGGFTVVRSTSTQATTTFLQVGGVASTSQSIIGALGVGVATTTQRNLEVGGNVYIQSGICNGCVNMSTTSATQALSTSNGNDTTLSASCSGTKKVIGGGFYLNVGTNAQLYTVTQNRALTSSSWIVTVICNSGSNCSSGNLVVEAMCTY